MKPPFSFTLQPGQSIQETSKGWIVLPALDPEDDPDDENIIEASYAKGWNACIDKIKELNK